MSNEVCKVGSIGKPGMILLDALCNKCYSRHQQWKFPCTNNCESGRVLAEPLGYKICPVCEGRSYLNKTTEPYCKKCGGDYPGSCYECD